MFLQGEMKKNVIFRFLIMIFIATIIGCSSKEQSFRKYRRIERRYAQNVDTLLNWAKSEDHFLRLFAALTLSKMDHKEAVPSLINAIGLTETLPRKSKDVVIYIPLPKLADIELIARCEKEYTSILRQIITKYQDRIPFQPGSTLEFLSELAELDCDNNYSGRYTDNNCEGISMDHYRQIEVDFQIRSEEEIKQQYESVIKPLLVEWFGDLVPED